MKRLSRRDFGKEVSVGVLGGLAAGSVTAGASGQESPSPSRNSPKRMTTALRDMIKGPGIIDSPGVHDPLTSKIAESVGFRCVTLEGGARGIVSCQMQPALSLEDLAEATRRIIEVTSIPVLVDAGVGFGDAANVYHTVPVLEHAGAAGIRIADQVFPMRFHYYMDGIVHIVPVDAMVRKIRYAAEARRDPDFVIGARTDAMGSAGFWECVQRANLYLQAGADYVLLFPRTADETKRVPHEVHGPLNFASGDPGLPGPPNLNRQELGEMGWKVLSYPAGAILEYYKAVRDLFGQLKETGSVSLDATVYGPVFKEVYQMLDIPAYYRIEYWTNNLGSAYRPGELPPIRTPETRRRR